MKIFNNLWRMTAWPLLSAALLSACGLIYSNVHIPYGYNTATPSDVKAGADDETVNGEACSYSLLYLVAWGNGGYAKAANKALGGRTDVILYDVKTDMKATAVLLGLYARTCTVITGRAGRP
ncbi:MAG: TRL domain-containing protein [Elusimicrobiota bacterium]